MTHVRITEGDQLILDCDVSEIAGHNEFIRGLVQSAIDSPCGRAETKDAEGCLVTCNVTASNYKVISISMDGVFAGSGKLVDGIIEDCGAQFCDDNDESLEVYDMIEEAICEGRESVKVEFSDDTMHTITWSVVEPS